jgi:hypothetical protein
MRLTTAELDATLHAITAITAGEQTDEWDDDTWGALERAETKVRAALHARKDYKAG